MGYDFTGCRIFDFPIDFSMGLTTVQRYCAACDYGTRSSAVAERLHDASVTEYFAKLLKSLEVT